MTIDVLTKPTKISNLNDLTLEEAQVFTKKHSYQPHNSWTTATLYKTYREGQYGKKGGEPRCWGECSHTDRITHWYQCDRPGKTRLLDGSTWCGIHSPEAVAKRDQRTKDRHHQAYLKLQAKSERWRKEAVQNQVFPALLDALQQIAEGHNAPRELAREALSKWPYPKG